MLNDTLNIIIVFHFNSFDLFNVFFQQKCLEPEQPPGPLPAQALDVRVARGCGDLKGNVPWARCP